MYLFSLSALLKAAKRRSACSRRDHLRPHRFVPRLTLLEDRTLPSTFTVLNLNDSGPGSLRAGIASGDATIAFATGLHGTITLMSGELEIMNSVTITGPGANQLAVSGNHASRVFETAAGIDVAISGLTITHGYALDQGGGILNDGANLTLTGDLLSGNVAVESATHSASGGAVQSLGGTVSITDCQVTGNQALGAAGMSAFGDAFGGGINIQAGRATIANSTLTSNRAQGGAGSSDGDAAGGAIHSRALLATVVLVITDSTISHNEAVGGADAPVNAGAGGGIACDGSVSISGTTFRGNVAVAGNGGIGPFVGEAEGGAVITTGGSYSISGSTFDQNEALGGSGGNSGPGQADPGVDESFGAAIFCFFGGSINVSGTTFSHNRSVGGNNATATGSDIVEVGVAEGGAICSEIGAAATFSGCTFDDNQAIGGNGNTGSGPVIHVGTGFGAGIFSGFGGVDVGANPLTVSNSLVLDNQAQGGNHNTGTASVAGLVGTGAGGGIMNGLGGTAAVSASTLSYNQAIGGNSNTARGAGAVFANLGAGGALFNWLGNYNSPPEDYGPLGPSIVTVSDCLLAFNLAQGGGGGNGEGGGIANLVAATTTVTSSVLTGNEATGGAGGAGLGGGAYNDATSSLALSHSLVAFNRADGALGIGGGVYTTGAFTDTLTLILGNHASTSGDDIGP
jgi:hypothetical protein